MMASREHTVNAARKTIDDEIAELRRDYYDCLLREAELKVKVVELETKVQLLLGNTNTH
jgi:hypothetical protein